MGIDWAVFLPAALVVSLVPGANQLLSLRNAVRHGAREATVALAGRFTAFAVLVTLAAAGLGAVLLASATAFAVVRWAGVAYLAVLGLSTLWRVRRDRGARCGAAEPSRRIRRRLDVVTGVSFLGLAGALAMQRA